MPDSATIYVVDRREGPMAILVSDAEETIEVDAITLPRGCRAEGAVLRVPLAANGQPQWELSVRDRAEERRRREHLSARLERLRRSDSGGDIVL